MIPPVAWLWKQLNGPQITAVASAVFQFMKESFDNILDYWTYLTIDNATSGNLTTMGALHGIARPLMRIVDASLFWFSEVPAENDYYPETDPYPTSEHGFADLNNLEIGGQFASLEDVGGKFGYISTPLYRSILKGSRDSQGALGSAVWLDDVLYSVYLGVQGTASVPPDYEIKVLQEEDLEKFFTRLQGDILVDLGAEKQWGVEFGQLVAELNLLGKTVYYPVPTLFATARI